MEKLAMCEDGGGLERETGTRDHTEKSGNRIRWLLVATCVFLAGLVVVQSVVEMYRLSLRVDHLERLVMTAASSGYIDMHDVEWPTSDRKELDIGVGRLMRQQLVPLPERYDLEPGGDVYASETSLFDETINDVNVQQPTPPLGRRTKRSLDHQDDDTPRSRSRRSPARNHRTSATDTSLSAGHSSKYAFGRDRTVTIVTNDIQKPEGVGRMDHQRRHRNHEVSAYQMRLNITLLDEDDQGRFKNGATIELAYGEYGPDGFRPNKYAKMGADGKTQYSYPYKMWSVADWANSSQLFQHNAENGQIVVAKKGIYFIYAQLLYCNRAVRSGYAIKTNEASPQVLARCWNSVDIVGSHVPSNETASPRLKTCHVGISAMLNANQQVWLEDLYGTFIKPDPDANFFGIIRLSE